MSIQELNQAAVVLASAQYNTGVVELARKAFPNNQHMVEKAKQYNGNLLGFIGYLDKSNRITLMQAITNA